MAARYFSTLAGSIGLSFTTARTPPSVCLMGTGRRHSSTHPSSPRPVFFGGPPRSGAFGAPKIPSIRPFV